MILYTVLDGLADSVFSISIVYGMLFLLSLAIRPLRWIHTKDKDVEPETPPAPAPKPFSIDDIKDEDMMAAALVAAIDARETMKTDVVVTSVKELK